MKIEHIQRAKITCPLRNIADYMIDLAFEQGLLEETVEGELQCESRYYDGRNDEIVIIMKKSETEETKEIE